MVMRVREGIKWAKARVSKRNLKKKEKAAAKKGEDVERAQSPDTESVGSNGTSSPSPERELVKKYDLTWAEARELANKARDDVDDDTDMEAIFDRACAIHEGKPMDEPEPEEPPAVKEMPPPVEDDTEADESLAATPTPVPQSASEEREERGAKEEDTEAEEQSRTTPQDADKSKAAEKTSSGVLCGALDCF
eukprot:CAMPEP_0118702400 /NCGR_PEP_ID=MMETSP0800-20121206/17870_1 /TAXON_ID=210618 ORGANISM="Striatella unipunctata, Strain CCMP2910" /NCGR_SAMPLE_ID=MMETSP0800 /ASSEMBLY_ACC=CAM_ASM_000638 /LENGTH=191 /DNA_ID=CAMNT_0006603597 /DNA_START=157 /DNA_END=732 /DNA_ORIENTATION=-